MIVAVQNDDLTPVAQLDMTGPLVAVLAACLLLAATLIACVVLLSRPPRARRERTRGAHSMSTGKAAWHARIDEVTSRHAAGDIDREEAFLALAAIARDFASEATGRDLSTHTLADLRGERRDPSSRRGLDLLRMTIEALYPPEFADESVNAHARQADVAEAAGWVSNLVERWGR